MVKVRELSGSPAFFETVIIRNTHDRSHTHGSSRKHAQCSTEPLLALLEPFAPRVRRAKAWCRLWLHRHPAPLVQVAGEPCLTRKTKDETRSASVAPLGPPVGGTPQGRPPSTPRFKARRAYNRRESPCHCDGQFQCAGEHVHSDYRAAGLLPSERSHQLAHSSKSLQRVSPPRQCVAARVAAR